MIWSCLERRGLKVLRDFTQCSTSPKARTAPLRSALDSFGVFIDDRQVELPVENNVCQSR